ncbi:MAG TPA: hypothetical protein VF120_03700 [Ktedonobacterales bacterium]
MTTRNESNLRPSPACERFAALLPLLDDADAATGPQADSLSAAREHVRGCPYCQAQQRAYGALDAALRRTYSLGDGRGSIAPRSTGEIMRYIKDRDTQGTAKPALSSGILTSFPRSRRTVLSGVLAVASVILLIGLSLVLFTGRLGSHGLGVSHSGPPRYTFPGTQGLLADVSMVSPNEGWALGQVTKTAQGNHSLKEVTFYHYANGAWTPVYVPTSQDFSEGGVSGFNGTISMDSASDGWAVASNFNRFSVVLHYTNGAWSQVSAPFVMKLQALSPTSVWATTASDVGYGASSIVHFDGTAWKTQTITGLSAGATPYIVDLQMTSDTAGWALLSTDIQNSPATYAVAEYSKGAQDATGKWKVHSTLSTGGFGNFSALTMVSPTDGWIIGSLSVPDSTGNTAHVPEKQLLYHYANGKWNDASLPYDSHVFTVFTSITMLSATDGWIVGYEQNNYVGSTAADYERVPVLYHYNGTSWSSVAAPDTGTPISAITGVSFTSSGSAWASGYASDIPGSDTVQDSDVLQRASPELFTYQNGAWSLYQS